MKKSKHQIISDRGQAIETAIKIAGREDVVVLAGKGHENYQEVMGRRIPFSDIEKAMIALENKKRVGL